MQVGTDDCAVAQVLNPDGASSVVVVCEHASNRIPSEFGDLGLARDLLESHIAWDPGALGVASHLGALLSARTVASKVSRLVYDCNRAPEAPDAIPERSEIYDIPGNINLPPDAREARVNAYYRPFERLMMETLESDPGVGELVTIHSFTPVYKGERRDVEIGILHEADRRLADAMLRLAGAFTDRVVRRNAPYGPEDGVTHTLKRHGIAGGFANVMIELRSDLIATGEQQREMAEMLGRWIGASIAELNQGGGR